MKKKFYLFTSAIILIACISLMSQPDTAGKIYYELFDKAELLFNGEATDESDSIALYNFSTIVSGLPLTAQHALLLYKCHEHIGILKQGLGYNSKDILNEYYAGLQIKKSFHLHDSLIFRLLLSAGNLHFSDGFFDSSVYYLSWAEKIILKYPAAGLAGDLYNSLGALYSESGNYTQSGYYFAKALDITKKTRPDLHEAIFAMTANIVGALRLSGKLDSSASLYKQLLATKPSNTPVLNNLARIYLIKLKPDSALYYLQQVHDAGAYTISYNNAIALAYMQKKDTINAEKYLLIAEDVYHQSGAATKSNVYGATCRYFGDLMLMKNNIGEALKYYQRAIIQLSLKFDNENIFYNPGNFTGDFASYELFNAILAKAKCFDTAYSIHHNTQYYKAAISTYDSAFALADYIKKSIDNDEARLFIADQVFNAYSHAIDFVLNKKNEINDSLQLLALKWISKSRAASLLINLKENEIKRFAGLPDSLLQKEKNIRISISRLKLQLQQVTDTAEENAILSAINTAAVQLNQLTNSYKQYPSYYRQKFAADSFNLLQLQQNIPDNNTAIICYFGGQYNMHAFVIKKNRISYFPLPYDKPVQVSIKRFTHDLAEMQSKQTDGEVSSLLYNSLLQPFENEIKNISSLIIIPDQQLINLPFEAFVMPDKKYLIEKYAVTYQYNLPLLKSGNIYASKKTSLAMAPFAEKSKEDFSALPSSGAEISSFNKPEQLLNAQATKQHFLSLAPEASLIHLATHAAVNYDDPTSSYIAFYPSGKEDSSYKIFSHELYNLYLPNTQLVFLSACETGSGKVSQSEGALSLSRAFAYAGCSNIITSLWKAEDKSTAYISERFYHYINKGYTYAEALQQAKKDLLQNASLSQFHAPQYWSHLIFIGDMQPQKSSPVLWLIFLVVAIILSAIFFYFRKGKRK